MNRIPLVVDKVQETFLCENGVGEIEVLSNEDPKKVLKRESCNFNRNDLIHKFDSPSTKCRIINDFTKMGKGSTLSKCIFPLEWLHIPGHLISLSA